jgi:ribosomal 50S subunit-recycling heat shock protein
MRVDLLLKSLCLVKTRNQGRKGCEGGCISVNGRSAKPSTEARPGDIVEIRYPRRTLAVEILEEPAGQVARRDCERYYRVVRESEVESREGDFWNDD